MRNIKIIFGVIILGLSLFTNYVAQATSNPLDKIVVVVNSDVITQSELNKKMTRIKQRSSGDNAHVLSDSALRQKAIDELIDASLQLQLARRNGIQITDSDLNSVIANIAKSNNMTIEKLKEILPQQEGMTFMEFRNQLREQGLISRVQQRFLGGEVMASITDKEVDAVLRNPPKLDNIPAQYHVVDVSFAIADGASKDQVDAVANAAKQMLVELRQGGDIEDAIKESQINFKEQIIKSEDLGWRKIDDLPALFAKEVAAMKINQVVGPIKAPNGLHILKLLAIHGSPSVSGKLTRAQAGDIVFQRKLNDKLKPWLRELRETAYIKIM